MQHNPQHTPEEARSMNIAAESHTFLAWLHKELAEVEAAAPTIETDIENGVSYSTKILKIVASQVEAGSPAANVISKATQDLLTLSAVAYDAGAHPTLASGFQDVVTNLGGLETATGIKNANTVATVGNVISTIASIASALLTIVPAV
jgi:hypothetical protein